MIITTKVKIDLKKPSVKNESDEQSDSTTVNAVQGDRNTRCVEVSIYANDEPWQIPSGVAVSMRYCKPDYTAGYYDTMPDGTRAWSAQGNVITMQLAPQMLTVVGTVTAQLELLLGDAILGTFSFYIRVEGNPAAGTITSEDYINWQQWIEAELDKYINTVKESGEFHGGTLSGPVNMNGNRLFGLPAPVSDNDAAPLGLVKRAAPRNLLDNSDFRNPVNQRGQPSYSLGSWGGYTIDRWRCGNRDLNLTFGNNGIYVDGYLYQVIPNPEKLVGKTITLAMKVNGKIYCTSSGKMQLPSTWSRIVDLWTEWGMFEVVTQNDNSVWAGFECTNSVVEWIALYEGEYTLDTLPEYQPMGYAAELAECRRYYRHYATIIPPHSSANDPYIFLGLETDMHGTNRTVNIGGIAGGDNVNVDFGGLVPGFSDDKKSLMFIQVTNAFGARAVYIKNLAISAEL